MFSLLVFFSTVLQYSISFFVSSRVLFTSKRKTRDSSTRINLIVLSEVPNRLVVPAGLGSIACFSKNAFFFFAKFNDRALHFKRGKHWNHQTTCALMCDHSDSTDVAPHPRLGKGKLILTQTHTRSRNSRSIYFHEILNLLIILTTHPRG